MAGRGSLTDEILTFVVGAYGCQIVQMLQGTFTLFFSDSTSKIKDNYLVKEVMLLPTASEFQAKICL